MDSLNVPPHPHPPHHKQPKSAKRDEKFLSMLPNVN